MMIPSRHIISLSSSSSSWISNAASNGNKRWRLFATSSRFSPILLLSRSLPFTSAHHHKKFGFVVENYNISWFYRYTKNHSIMTIGRNATSINENYFDLITVAVVVGMSTIAAFMMNNQSTTNTGGYIVAHTYNVSIDNNDDNRYIHGYHNDDNNHLYSLYCMFLNSIRNCVTTIEKQRNCSCEEISQQPQQQQSTTSVSTNWNQNNSMNDEDTNEKNQNGSKNDKKNRTIQAPSWMKRRLYQYGLISHASLVPRYVTPYDMDLVLPKKYIQQRIHDEKLLASIQQQIQQVTLSIQQQQLPNEQQSQQQQNKLYELINEMYHILYGDHVTPQQRQEFLYQYGCTGYTDDIISKLVQLEQHPYDDDQSRNAHHHNHRGFIEIGAGNGQWARILTDRYHREQQKHPHGNNKLFEYVLAYDNMSSLPLNPRIYHRKTKIYHDYFYHHIRPMPTIIDRSNDNDHEQAVMDMIFQQWQCRHRILLLVYPPPGPMAYYAMKSYIKYNYHHHNNNNNNGSISYNKMIIVYVGEGRGGANANDDFFNLIEGHDHDEGHDDEDLSPSNIGPWILQQMLPVHICGTKGYEKLYIFQQP